MRAEYEVLSKSAYDAWVDKKVAEALAARSPQPAVAPQADTATVASLTK
jgi:heme/copper-type cytochrome/quinol oxidase subunit 2